MSSFTLVSSQTQRLLSPMLSNRKFTANYITKNRERLKKRNHNLIEGLRSAGIECLKGNAGLFCWINLMPLVEKASRESELEVWRKILEEAKLNISPESSCHCSEAGWFRVHGTLLILSFPDVLIYTQLHALKTGTDGSRIGSRKVYGSDSIRKPVVPPGKVVGEIFGREKNEGQGNHEEEEEEEDDGWVDWDDKILDDTVPLISFVRMILHSGTLWGSFCLPLFFVNYI